MQKDIRLHGLIDDKIEYYAIVAGMDAHQRYFFNQGNDDEEMRFFSPGNEFIIGKTTASPGQRRVLREYMFGVDQPISDFAKGDVINRLVVYGARYDKPAGALRFSDRTEGSHSFDKIFFDGNAVFNYFFSSCR